MELIKFLHDSFHRAFFDEREGIIYIVVTNVLSNSTMKMFAITGPSRDPIDTYIDTYVS